jgi:hypothetical protein
MGQQQLLLIVLGVILVGIAVVLGIQYFGTGAEQGAKDELTAHNTIIASNAQEWFNKPKSMGGGGLSFLGFGTEFTDNLTRLHSSTNCSNYTTTAGTDAEVDITALPDRTSYNWRILTKVYADSVVTSVLPGRS